MSEKPEHNIDAELSAIQELAQRNYGVERPFADNLLTMLRSGGLPAEALPLIREALERRASFQHPVHGAVNVNGGPGAVGISNLALGLVLFLHN